MNAVLATKTTYHWVEVLEAAGVPCGPVYNYAQIFADPQVRHRGLVQHASDAELGNVPHIRTPVKIGEGAGGYRRPQARPAQHPDLRPPGRERGGAARIARALIFSQMA
jgi:crotonobetainyl-CoA:carnitine CoA-transferase CaiB-like acyl-CoA transferase